MKIHTLLIFCFAFLILALPAYPQRTGGKDQPKHMKPGTQPDDQEEEDPFPVPKFEFGLNFGTYFANKYSANFYNGTPWNVNNVNYVLSNPTWNREIKQLLGISEYDTFFVQGYPLDMHYSVSFFGGIFLRYNLNKHHALFVQANYTQLKASDVLTLEVPNIYLSYPDLRFETVAGREGRVLIDVGYQYAYRLKSRIYLYLQASATMCYSQMKQCSFIVEGRTYDMVNNYGNQIYVPNTNMQTMYVNQNAFGFGGSLGLGVGVPLTEMFGVELGSSMQYYPSNLEHYPDFKPSFNAYLRILLHFVATEDRY